MKGREFGVCLGLALAAAGWLWVRAPAPVHSDFCSYHAAGRLVLEGRAVEAYDAAALEKVHRATHDVGRRAGPFLYSPLLLLPSALFATAPLPLAAAANRVVAAVALGLGLFLILAALDGWRWRLAVAIAFALAHATSVQLLYENWTFLLFALLAAGALALARDRPLAAGAVAAAAVHLKALALFAFLPLAAGNRRRVLAWAALAGLVLTGISVAATGIEPWRKYGSFLVSRGEAGVTPYYNKSSLAANLARIETEPRDWVSARRAVDSIPVRAVFWLALPLLGWGAWRLRATPGAAYAFGIAWTLLFVPQIWEHTEVLLIAALPALGARWRAAAVALLGASFFYGELQQTLLREVLAGTRSAATLQALLLFYPVLGSMVLVGALGSGKRVAARASRRA